MPSYGGIYPAFVVDSSATPARVRVSQVWQDVTIPLHGIAAIPPVAGEIGWVAFVNGQAEYPVWLGANQPVELGSGGGPGAPGLSAYQLAVQQGFVGSLNDWLVSLQGGPPGPPGAPGAPGVPGPSVAPGTISGGSQNLGLPGVIIAATFNARAIDNSRMWYVPFVTNGSMTVDRMVCEVTTGVASSNLRMGVYAADAAWQPTGAALIDTGDISAASAAVKTATVSATLPPGRYLACIFADLAGVIVRAATVIPTWATEINTAAFVGGTGSIIPGAMRALTKTYGALTTATPWDSYVSSYTGAVGDWPLILLRWT